jgi:hypothetical protein
MQNPFSLNPKQITDEFDKEMYQQFWKEYDQLLLSKH